MSEEREEQLRLIDWRIGHHIEAGMGLIAGAITLLSKSVDKLATAQGESNAIQRRLVALQEENIQTAKVMREMADSFLRGPGSMVEPTREPIRPPDWLKDELKGD